MFGSIFILQAVMRCIVGYFMDMPKEEIPYIQVPLHTIIKLTPTAHSEFIASLASHHTHCTMFHRLYPGEV